MTANEQSLDSEKKPAIGPGKLSWYITLQAVGMIGAAAIVGTFWKPAFWSIWSLDWKAAAMGIVVGFILAVVAMLTEKLPMWPFTRLEQDFQKMIGLFREASYLQLFWISLCAGVSEEILLRGCMEPILRGYHGTVPAMLIVALVFGGLHFLSAAYALTIAFISILFSLLMLQTDNLISPIAAHAVYDFLALAYAVKVRQPEGESAM